LISLCHLHLMLLRTCCLGVFLALWSRTSRSCCYHCLFHLFGGRFSLLNLSIFLSSCACTIDKLIGLLLLFLVLFSLLI
jgi:hypothetical protein